MDTMPYVDKRGLVYGYGEFYPSELSHFGYNETIAQERFPLSEEEAYARGFKWQEHVQRTIGKETISPDQIPDSISDVPEFITNEILVCINCKRNYKIIPDELKFYQYLGIPIPRRCFYCRHSARIKRRNPFTLWHRSCMCEKTGHEHNENCQNEFETTYAPDRPEIVYCEKCYQLEFS